MGEEEHASEDGRYSREFGHGVWYTPKRTGTHSDSRNLVLIVSSSSQHLKKCIESFTTAARVLSVINYDGNCR